MDKSTENKNGGGWGNFWILLRPFIVLCGIMYLLSGASDLGLSLVEHARLVAAYKQAFQAEREAAQAGGPAPSGMPHPTPAPQAPGLLQAPGRELCFGGGGGYWIGGHGLCRAWDSAPVPDARLMGLRFRPIRAQMCAAEDVDLGLVVMPCSELQGQK